MGIESRLAQLDGCARTGLVVTSSADKRELAALVGQGRVIRIARGLVALPHTASDVIGARACHGVLTCVSAAARWQLALVRPPDRPHVAVAAHRGPPVHGRALTGAVVHWSSGLRSTVGLTAPVPLALVHAMDCLPFVEAVALLDSAVHRGVVRVEDVGAHRPVAGRLVFDSVLRAVDGRSASLPESVVRLALRAEGLWVEPQVEIRGVGRVDLLVEDRVVVEVDGFAYHSGRTQYREDRRRDRVVHLLGLPVLRFTYEDAMHATGRAAAEVVAMVALARRIGVRPLPGDLLVRSV